VKVIELGCPNKLRVCADKQGITLRLSEDGRCLVARIIHDGMMHKQGEFAFLLCWLLVSE
jgi:hypothetical protein